MHPIAIKWLKTWGVDLKLLYDDQFLRNDSSYRPNHLSTLPNNDSQKICSFITSLWKNFEPSAGFEFSTIDKHLLRLCLEMQFKAQTGNTPINSAADYLSRVSNMLDSLMITGAAKAYFERFLSRQIVPEDPAILVNSFKVGSTEDPEFHLQVLSRAALLLRLATGSVANSFANNGITQNDLSFWMDSQGLSRGFWHPASPPADLKDLWEDVSDACDVLEDWDASVASGNLDNSMASFLSGGNLSALSTVCGFEKIALWGFCS